MRLTYISDTDYWKQDDDWYTTIAWPVDFIADRFPSTQLTFVGRQASSAFGQPLPTVTQSGCEVVVTTVPSSGRGPLSYVRNLHLILPILRRMVREADVLYLKPGVLASIARRFVRQDQIVLYHQVGDLSASLKVLYPRFAWLARVMEGESAKIRERADIVAYVSRALVHDDLVGTEKVYIANESRVRDVDIVSEPSLSPQSPPRIGYIGRLSPEKGVGILPGLAEQLRDCRIVIAGEGRERAKLEADFAARGATSRVDFLGKVTPGLPVLELIRSLDVVVLPSYTEGLPLILIEAMSQGVPVVATPVGGVPSLIQDGVNGVLVEPMDQAGFAHAVQRLITDHAFREQMIRRGIETAKSNTLESQLGPLLDRIVPLHQERNR